MKDKSHETLHPLRFDRTWTDRVDAEATGSVFEVGSLGLAYHKPIT